MTDTTPQPLSGFYRVVWRWHFYAGLLVAPILMLMALTGGLYLFKAEIEDLAHGRISHVESRAGQASPDRWRRAAEVAAGGGQAASVFLPDRPDRAVQVRVRGPSGERTVFVDPHDAQVTGVMSGDGIMGVVKQVHSLSLLGRPFNILVEIVAGWAIILVVTGLYLWLPRGRPVAAFALRKGDPNRRPFWRDLHAVTGLYAGAVIVFLAVTGMPWSAVWGERFQTLVRENGWGRPPAPAAASPWAHGKDHDAPAAVGWTLEHSVLHAPHHGGGAARLSTVIAAAETHGMARPYTVSIPADPGLAFTVAHAARRAEDARILHVDARTGALLGDSRWAAFGPGAKGFEWGIAVHEGRQYGWANRMVMLGGCIAVWVLAISGLMMWWKRRPARGGFPPAPPAPPDARLRGLVLGLVLPFAILYPLTGLSLLAAVLLDRAARTAWKLRPSAS